MDVEEYIELFKRLQKAVGDEAAIAIVAEVGKDARVRAMANRNIFVNHSNGDGITDKQRNYLEFLNVKIPKDCTRQQASDLIDKALAE